MAGALREIIAKFGFEIADADKLDAAEKKADGFADSLKEIAGTLIGAALIDGVKSFVLEIQEAGDALNDTSARLGVATNELQRWQFAAKMSGSSAESLNMALLILQKNVADAAEGGGEAAKIFAEFGIPIKDSAGQIKNATQLMGDVGLEIAKLKTPAERTAASLKVFGKQGSSLVPIFADGEEGLQALLDRFDELGGGYSQDALAGAGAVGDAIDEMGYAVTGLKSRLAVSLFPTLSEMLKYFTKTIVMFGKTTQGSNIFQAALLVLGAVAAKVAFGMYAKYLPMVAVVALLVLLIDDLITAFKGGDSAIAKLIDKLLGDGSGKGFFKWVNEGLDDLGKRLDKTPGFADKIAEVFSSVGFTLVKFFVDDLPEAWDFFWKDLNKEARTGGKTFTDFWIALFKDVIKSHNEFFKEIGDSIVQGLIDGITEKWSKLKETFTELSNDLKGVMPKVFKSHSPSEVTHDNGVDIVDGTIGGLAARSKALQDQAKKTYSLALPTNPVDTNYTPMLRVPSSAGGSTASYSVQQVNHNQFSISGGSTNLTNAVRDGASLAFSDDRRAALAALETLGEDA